MTPFAYASDMPQNLPHYPWYHNGMNKSYDSASLRRGYEVYRQVCATCHSMNLIHFRDLVGATHTEAQAKALAASYSVTDGPDSEGNMFKRPGKLTDSLPAPYPNDEFARNANAGALPPDLSVICDARHGGPDYVMALLTGYREPPAGVTLREGLHYNPYFAGGAISMAEALSDGLVDNEDGVPATKSQMAKDVSAFLMWCAEPEQDERRLTGLKCFGGVVMATALAAYYKKHKWLIFKSRRISYTKAVKNPYGY
eukprot:CAMPEP_0205821956 /NCGR_PEP_ID=MMETSP0206-20130828/10402_1 /ASSEMBLY_ACC=CAM_ASM_000279 /TAXON_ID=36767 /ORGANISM="Euplotes focardii, Strain TN1" /LENGTH=254 /DNA_ID=CAMNT_0053117845 /DNA_START=90 /DNA_END=854 /DNA_ORIENTATION=+